MALVSGGYSLTVSLVDSGGDVSNLTYNLVAADETAALAARDAILAAIADVSGLVVKSTSLALRQIEDALVLPAPQYQSQQKAKIVCRIDGDPTKAIAIYIPGPLESMFIAPGDNLVDGAITNTDLHTYLDIWKLTGAIATISDGEFLADNNTVKSGVRVHRQSSAG